MPTPRASRGASTTEISYALGGERSDQDRPQGQVLVPTPLATDGTKGDLLPTPRGSAERTSKGAALRKDSRSSPSLEQAIEIASGQIPREFEGFEDLPESWHP
ncbi:DNA methylase domain protein [Mycobacterium phage Babsiella]|uniref:DNA methylase domain protein n=1 Tax=Mycobacterium phage Babsiella TaxID=2902842 RepID=G8I6T8_9CAUD|nr:DNA methylase domain protein [Mycobacterium phage Babsiella]AER48431.1 DNA methylase domain protein [Mycobacterium phage Babsiella]